MDLGCPIDQTNVSSERVVYNHKLCATRSEDKEIKKVIATLNIQIPLH